MYFLDETFEELTFDALTTVADATPSVAGTIRLREYATFGLFADAVASADADDADDADTHTAHTAHVALADTELICDVLQDLKGPRRTQREDVEETSERARNPFKTFKTGKDVPGTEERTDEEKTARFGAPRGAPRLVFKKRMFRDTDESVTEPVFVSLSYLQLKRDFLDGRYPVNAADAAQLCALQIQAEDGGGWAEGAHQGAGGRAAPVRAPARPVAERVAGGPRAHRERRARAAPGAGARLHEEARARFQSWRVSSRTAGRRFFS